jgi:hypothetical protein
VKKHDELTDPTSCLNKARDDEYLFVLRAHDVAAPMAIRHWTDVRINLRKNRRDDPEILDASRSPIAWRPCSAKLRPNVVASPSRERMAS